MALSKYDALKDWKITFSGTCTLEKESISAINLVEKLTYEHKSFSRTICVFIPFENGLAPLPAFGFYHKNILPVDSRQWFSQVWEMFIEVSPFQDGEEDDEDYFIDTVRFGVNHVRN